MRAFATDLVHVFFSLPFYAVCLAAVLSVGEFRAGRSSHLYHWRIWLAVLAASGYVASAEIVGNLLIARFEAVHPVPSLSEERFPETVILVLTAGTPRLTAQGYRPHLSADGVQRVTAAVGLWQRIGGKLLFSGAPVPDQSDSMADEMARFAVGLGVSRDAILVEPRSRNTYENMVFSRRLLRDAGLLGSRIVMVVSAFQMPRAVAVASKLELEVLPYPCGFQANPHPGWQYWIPSNDGAQTFEAVMHEVIGLGAYWWRGWI